MTISSQLATRPDSYSYRAIRHAALGAHACALLKFKLGMRDHDGCTCTCMRMQPRNVTKLEL